MHKARPRRDDIIIRTLTYIFMTIMVIVLAFLCLFIVLGYSFDQKTGQAQQGGLIQFRSFPENASVSLNGKLLGFTTPGKTNAPAGHHTASISKKDYRGWSKSFDLRRGELLWHNARLVPNSITTNEAVRFDSIAQAMASPDKKWIVIVEKASEPVLKIIDVRDEKKPKTITLKIPSELTKALPPTGSFGVIEWDSSSRYLLVKHVSDGQTQWLRLDRSDETNVENISDRFKLDFSEVHFTGSSDENFYGLDGGTLRRLSLDQPEPQTVVIAQGVKELSLGGNGKMAMVAQESGQQLAMAYRNGDQSPAVVETIPQIQPAAHADTTSFLGGDYAAVSHGGEARITKNPFNDKPKLVAKLKLPSEIQWLFFSPNGQFLIAQAGLNVTGYNLERDQQIQFTIPGDGPYARANHLDWIDSHHFWSDMGGVLRVFEFDGSNAEVLNNVMPGYGVSLSDNGKRLFSIGLNSTTKKPVLQSSVMVVE